MDDVLIASYTEREHLDHITQVFEQFCRFKMKLKLAKCEFGRSKIQFLGHIINHEGIRTFPDKNRRNLKDQGSQECGQSTHISWIPELLSQIHPSIFRLNASHPETPEKEREI